MNFIGGGTGTTETGSGESFFSGRVTRDLASDGSLGAGTLIVLGVGGINFIGGGSGIPNDID